MTRRRDFIRQASLIAAGTLAAGSVGAQETGGLAAVGAPDASHAPSDWDMSWTARVTGKHRMAFDAHEISFGACLHQVRSFLSGYADAYALGDSDLTAVLIVRHTAVPMILGDALWADGAFGEKDKLKDPETGEPTKRNPFINIPVGAKHALTWADGALDTLMSRGVIVLGCDLALGGAAGQIASRMKIPRQDALALVAQHLLPGVYRMPTGVFATCHAQSIGCGVMNAV